MYIKNDPVKRLYRVLFLLLCTTGIVLQYAIVARIGSPKMLSCYYTIQSNVLCLVYFAGLLVCQPKRENPMVKGLVMLGIVITGLVYHFMLNGAMEAGVGAVAEVTFTEVLANTLVHYVVPLMTVGDYLLFAPKGGYRWMDPLKWLSLPALYVVFVMIRAQVDSGLFAGFSGKSRYPYPFVDVDLYGVGMVCLMVGAILLAFWVLGMAIVGLDHLMGRAAKQ